MRHFYFTLLLLSLGFSRSVFAQTVAFNADSIFINKVPCFSYVRDVNDFSIKSSDGKVLITGSITNISPGQFETHYTFLTVNKQFYNKKINGRNTLIFALVQTKVIDSCQLVEEPLLRFIKKYNEPEGKN